MSEPRYSVRDLSSFREDLPWDKRLELIRRTFASAPLMGLADVDGQASWKKAFDHDVDLVGRILRDVLKADQAVPGRPGPRPALNVARAQPVLDEWMGDDPLGRPYTLLCFAEALTLMVKGHPLRQVSRKTGIAHSHLHRLLAGEREPTSEVMEKVALAFDKSPSYFLEYRMGTIAAAILWKLSRSPEKTIHAFESLYWTANGSP